MALASFTLRIWESEIWRLLQTSKLSYPDDMSIKRQLYPRVLFPVPE